MTRPVPSGSHLALPSAAGVAGTGLDVKGPQATGPRPTGVGPTAGTLMVDIRVAGHLDDHWAADLGDLVLTRLDDGTTRLTGPVVDQAKLHGILARIRDLGVPLLSLQALHSGDDPGDTTSETPAETLPSAQPAELRPRSSRS